MTCLSSTACWHCSDTKWLWWILSSTTSIRAPASFLCSVCNLLAGQNLCHKPYIYLAACHALGGSYCSQSIWLRIMCPWHRRTGLPHKPLMNPEPLHFLQGIKPVPPQVRHNRGFPNRRPEACSSCNETPVLRPLPSHTKHCAPPARNAVTIRFCAFPKAPCLPGSVFYH